MRKPRATPAPRNADRIEVRVGVDAAPGNVLVPLARLLLQLAHRELERRAVKGGAE